MLEQRASGVTERRAARRQRVAYRLDVGTADGFSGCLLDVSASGMRVRFRKEIDVSTIQSLRIDFPRWLELGAGLEVLGRFVWVRSTPNEATEAGFAFDGLSRKVQSVLEVLVHRLSAALAEDQGES